MSVPSGFAGSAVEALPGVLHWTMRDDRIDFRSDAWAVHGADGRVLIDPLPLSDEAIRTLGRVTAICLTAPSHQRAAWSLRGALGAPVWAPDGSVGLDAAPDRTFAAGARLPAGLTALDAPGPPGPHLALRWNAPDGRAVLFVGDLLVGDGVRAPGLLPAEHLADPSAARATAARLGALGPDVLALAHGGLWIADAPGVLTAASVAPDPRS